LSGSQPLSALSGSTFFKPPALPEVADLTPDRVALVKKNGVRTENIKASVQRGHIRTFDTTIDVEDGDYIERIIPNGRVERYLILDTGYNPSLKEIPASYNMKVKKDSALVENKSSSSIVYTIHGPNARINISSTDASINVSSVNESELFDKMKEAVIVGIENETDQQAILKSIAAMQAEIGQKSFVYRYKEFVSVVADHIGILGPYMPALTQWLTGSH
jgi:hypothetical protein